MRNGRNMQNGRNGRGLPLAAVPLYCLRAAHLHPAHWTNPPRGLTHTRM